MSQFLVSTRPNVLLEWIVWSVKDGLQHAVQQQRPKAFRRNYGLRSVGSTTRETVEQYVRCRSRTTRWPTRGWRRSCAVEINDPSVDLSAPRRSAHGLYWYNLQVCFVNDGRCMEVRPEPLLRMREMIVKSAAKHVHLLSTGGIVADTYPPDPRLQCR